MPLAMPRPMKRQGTTSHQLIQRIPSDLVATARGRTLALPIGPDTVRVTLSEKAIDIRVSLRTGDPNEARGRHAAVVAYLEKAWTAMRSRPATLTHRETVALSGILYRDLVAHLEDEPGEPAFWAEVVRAHQRASESGGLERWLGATVDDLLLRQGLNIDAASRGRLLEAAAKALVDAAGRLGANAEGDYRPDPVVNRFPDWTGAVVTAKPKPPSLKDGTSLLSLFNKLAAERAYAPKTVSEWTRVVNSLTEHTGIVDAASITPDHLIAWTDALVEKGLSAKTINETNLAAVKAIFRWAKAKRLIATNPALETPKVERRDEDGGKRGFTLAEAQVVLQASLKEKQALRRWVPWLLAHTGARAGEIVQLRRQDVKQDPETGIWFIDIAPTAGRLKNRASARVVPIHPQLLAMGFTDWVKAQKTDRLFYEERDGEAEDGRRSRKSVTTNRLGDWVRKLEIPGVLTGEVSPNHGWRHRVVTELTNHDVTETVRKRITGHTLEGQDNRYVGRIVLERLREAIERLPSYAIGGAPVPS